MILISKFHHHRLQIHVENFFSGYLFYLNVFFHIFTKYCPVLSNFQYLVRLYFVTFFPLLDDIKLILIYASNIKF